MYAEAKKLHIIEEVLKVNSDVVLAELENILTKSNSSKPKFNFNTLVGVLTPEEVDELECNIQEGRCLRPGLSTHTPAGLTH
jgi:hypothetical protein